MPRWCRSKWFTLCVTDRQSHKIRWYGTVSFKYDPFGHRIYKQSTNSTRAGGRGLKAPQGAWVPHVSVFETWGFSAPVLFRSGQGMKFIASSGVPRPEKGAYMIRTPSLGWGNDRHAHALRR